MLSQLASREVQAVMVALPVALRSALGNVPVFLEWRPGPEDAARGIDRDNLGYFDPGPSEIPMPRIRLWLENLWDYSENNEAAFCEEVRTTLLHEIGHAVGMDEEDVENRGLG